MRILITGSREWSASNVVYHALMNQEDLLDPSGSSEQITVVHGGARGADTTAGIIAEGQGWNVEVHLPDWRPYGIYNPQAGKLRNSQMVALGADICLAFIKDNSGGATDCADKAEAAGIKTVRYVA